MIAGVVIEVDRFNEHRFVVEAKWQGRVVGTADCVIQANRLRIYDITVQQQFRPAWPRRMFFLNWISRPMDLRGRGIGTMILKRVLSEAAAVGCTEVWGSVVRHDILEAPTLLAWYERNGFSVSEPDAECLANATKKVRYVMDNRP
jgi:hypothetical protein